MRSPSTSIEIKIGNDHVRLNSELTFTQCEILRMLSDRLNHFVGQQEMQEKFQHGYSAGRENPKWNARVYICELRKALKGKGYEIITSRCRGYMMVKSDCKEM